MIPINWHCFIVFVGAVLNIITVYVTASSASLHFQSDDVSGNHFTATASFSFACPTGFHIDGPNCDEDLPVTSPLLLCLLLFAYLLSIYQCAAILQTFQGNPSIQTAVFITAA